LLSDARLFDVECECGAEFRVASEPGASKSGVAYGLMVPLEGSCPWCGLRLEEIEPPGPGSRRRNAARR
jgi:hypothetical protein